MRPDLGSSIRASVRPGDRFGRGEMTMGEKVKAILAGIVIGLMLAAPVAALVAVAGNNNPGIFHDLSPWSFAPPR